MASARVLAVVVFLLAGACRSRDRSSGNEVHADPPKPAVVPSNAAKLVSSLDPASDDSIQVIVSTAKLLVDGKEILTLPSREDAARDGFGAANKPSGASSFGPVAPLAAAFDKHVFLDDSNKQAMVLGEREAPFRLIDEVMFTLGQKGVTKFHFLVMSGSKGDGGTASSTPAAPLPPVPMHEGTLWLDFAIEIHADGAAIKTKEGTFGTGCKLGGSGITVPRVGGLLALDGIRRCAQQIKSKESEWTEVILGATGGTPFHEIIDVMDTVRTDGNVEMFPEVVFSGVVP